MSKKKKNKDGVKVYNKSEKKDFITSKRLGQETVYSIWSLVFLALGILFTLSGFGKSGNAGKVIFSFFSALFGWGYFLLPLTFFGASLNFVLNRKETKLYYPTLWGSILFILSSLGFIDVLFDGRGGILGTSFGFPKNWFGGIAWGIILFIAVVIGVLVIFDIPIKVKRELDEEEEEEKKIEKEIKIKIPENPQASAVKEENKKEEEMNFASFSSPKKSEKLNDIAKKFTDYKAPPMDLLRSSVEKPGAGDLRANANIIKRTLESFGIPVEMGEINIGPKVTRYTLRPAEGIKLSRIVALNQDLSLALSAHPIRIEAPIPGKPYVGIEVPNKSAAIVRLGNLISYPEFVSTGSLGFCLGRDVTGEPVFSNIEKMPHMLVAGATGSGKSITLHSILVSLLYKNSPATLKFILIDPKRVELSAYNNLPHLISPVVTQGKKALGVFRWAISEMDRRYETLLKAGARDIQSYNKKSPENILPFIIIVVDEMADLMAAYGRDIENAIVRLAQMARATGIHLILSTQRPSVEVITGLIKANITSRVALQVASQIDSRTILDTAGAEKLLGGGDLLFVSAELSKPRRIQGAYISEEEIKNVTDFIKKNNEDWQDIGQGPEFEEGNGNGGNGSGNGSENAIEIESKDPFEVFEDSDDDDLLNEAIEVVKQAKKASASLLQRRLKVGYARAARLLDLMEEKGLIGAGDGAKPRDVFISDDAQDQI